jgi:hypothetical protein
MCATPTPTWLVDGVYLIEPNFNCPEIADRFSFSTKLKLMGTHLRIPHNKTRHAPQSLRLDRHDPGEMPCIYVTLHHDMLSRWSRPHGRSIAISFAANNGNMRYIIYLLCFALQLHRVTYTINMRYIDIVTGGRRSLFSICKSNIMKITTGA